MTVKSNKCLKVSKSQLVHAVIHTLFTSDKNYHNHVQLLTNCIHMRMTLGMTVKVLTSYRCTIGGCHGHTGPLKLKVTP